MDESTERDNVAALRTRCDELAARIKVLEEAFAPLEGAAWNPTPDGYWALYSVSGPQLWQMLRALRSTPARALLCEGPHPLWRSCPLARNDRWGNEVMWRWLQRLAGAIANVMTASPWYRRGSARELPPPPRTTGAPYRKLDSTRVDDRPFSFDEQRRRQTNQRLANELIAMIATARRLRSDGLTIAGAEAQEGADRIAALMKERGV